MASRTSLNSANFSSAHLNQIVKEYDAQCQRAVEIIKKGEQQAKDTIQDIKNAKPSIPCFFLRHCLPGFPQGKLEYFYKNTLLAKLNEYESIYRSFKEATALHGKLRSFSKEMHDLKIQDNICRAAAAKEGTKARNAYKQFASFYWDLQQSIVKVYNATVSYHQTLRSYHSRLDSVTGDCRQAGFFIGIRSNFRIKPLEFDSSSIKVSESWHDSEHLHLYWALRSVKETNPHFMETAENPPVLDPSFEIPVNLTDLRNHFNTIFQNIESEGTDYSALELTTPLLASAPTEEGTNLLQPS